MFVDNVTYTGQQGASLPTVTRRRHRSLRSRGRAGQRRVHRHSHRHERQPGRQLHRQWHGHWTGNADYTALPGSVTIPSGSSTATITVVPVNDSISEGNETVILTLSNNSDYDIGSSINGTVTIADNDVGVHK